MRHRFAATFLLLIATFLLSGHVSARAVPTHPHAKRYTIDLIVGTSTDPFYITLLHGARNAARHLGINLLALGAPDAFTATSQIPYVELAIQQHASAILISPTDKYALQEPLRRAIDAGIPVITLDTSLATPLAVTHVSSRNQQGGRLAADALARAIGLHGTLAGISVRPGVTTTDEREQGFVQRLRHYAGITYLGTSYDNDSTGRATRLAAADLAAHPALSGIFAMNTVSGTGAINAVFAAHKEHQIKLVEFDTEPLQVFMLRRGIVDALVAQDPWAMGNLGVHLAYRWLTGNRSGIKKSYFTPEALITRSNVNKPKLARFLYGTR